MRNFITKAERKRRRLEWTRNYIAENNKVLPPEGRCVRPGCGQCVEDVRESNLCDKHLFEVVQELIGR